MAISPVTVEMIEKYQANLSAFAEDCLFVQDINTAEIVPLQFNKGQRVLHAVAEKQKEESGRVRILLLKTRRFGGSTYIEARFYWLTSLNWNRHTFIISHETESTDTLYNMALLYHERNPIRPATVASNAKELVFDRKDGKGLKSQYRLATAKNLSAGRSQGIHYLHDSEEAYWVNAEALLPSLLACLPKSPAESECFRESTANGYGNRFQKDCLATYDSGAHPYYIDPESEQVFAWQKPGNDWVLVLIPWYAYERYTKDFRSEEDKEKFAERIELKVFNKDTSSWEDSEELLLKKRFNLTLEQLNWRSWIIETDCRGRVEIFHQEYPATVEEAFLSTGSNVYGADLCDLLEAQCKPPIIVGDVVERLERVVIRPNPHGSFRIWEKPDPTRDYFLTVDSAGGLHQDTEKREPDPTCIDVWDRLTGVQVAQWHGHINYDLIAELVHMIGKHYAVLNEHLDPTNLPVACVELNNHGYTVIAGLVARRYPLFEHKENVPGWNTNVKTKPQMVDGLYEMTRDGLLQIRCVETISEMRTFVDKGGQYGAEIGCHDERVDTACMASQMLKLLPRKIRKDGQKRHDADDGGFVNWKRRSGSRELESGYEEVYAP